MRLLVALLLTLSMFVGAPNFIPEVQAKGATGAIDARTFKQLTKAQEQVAQGAYGEALETLHGIDKKKGLSSYARAQVWNYIGYVHATEGKYQLAIDAYQRVLKQDDSPEALLLNARYVSGQLYFQLEKFQSAIDSLMLWIEATKKPSSIAYVMLAQAHYQLAQHKVALQHLDTAITLNAEKEAVTPEAWLQLKAALHFATSDIKRTATVYEMLIQHYPKLRYLKQLAGLYGELGLAEKRLSVFDAVFEHGDLTKGKDQLNLAYMYLEQEVPYKAGMIIEDALANGRLERNLKNQSLLANIWGQAGQYDKAIPAYQDAATLADDGELYARLAGVFYQAANYRECVKAATAADNKGGLDSPGQNFLLKGLSLVNLGELEQALQAFRQAKDHKASFKAAKEWESYTLAQLSR